MDWATLETYWSLEEAQLAVAYLESHQVPCRLDGTAVAGNLWHLANATGGVKLMVAPDFAEQAAQLLIEVEAHRGEHAGTDVPEEQPASDAPSTPADFEAESDAPDRYGEVDKDEGDDEHDRPTFMSQLRDQRGWLLLLILWPVVIVVGAVMVAILNSIVS